MTERERAKKDHAEKGVDFDEIEAWHMENGWVINAPYGYAMGYFYKDNGETVCYISYATGDMHFLMLFRSNIIIDKIEFMRNCKGRTKKYDFERFVKKI